MSKRAVAYKLKISDVNEAEFHTGTSMEDPNYINVNGNHVMRVSVAGTIADRYANFENSSGIEKVMARPSEIPTDEELAQKKEEEEQEQESQKKDYVSLKIEHEGSSINAKFFDARPDAQRGDMVKVIGKVRENGRERYILSEIIKKISGDELRLHILESRKPAQKIEEPRADESSDVIVEEVD